MLSKEHCIVTKARSIGLHVKALNPIPGDGNCFYHAIIDTLSVTRTPYLGNHMQLRREIVAFVEANRNKEFLRLWESTTNENLTVVIKNQYKIWHLR